MGVEATDEQRAESEADKKLQTFLQELRVVIPARRCSAASSSRSPSRATTPTVSTVLSAHLVTWMVPGAEWAAVVAGVMTVILVVAWWLVPHLKIHERLKQTH